VRLSLSLFSFSLMIRSISFSSSTCCSPSIFCLFRKKLIILKSRVSVGFVVTKRFRFRPKSFPFLYLAFVVLSVETTKRRWLIEQFIFHCQFFHFKWFPQTERLLPFARKRWTP
jgi:hypothetical protein